MKRVVTLIAVLALTAAAARSAVAATPINLAQPNWFHSGARSVAAPPAGRLASPFRPGKAPKTTRPSRSLAATSSSCVPVYTTNFYARIWPMNIFWRESYCTRRDESVPGSLYIDDDFYFVTGTAWSWYGTWANHETLVGGVVRSDFCYWENSSGVVFGPFYNGCL